MTTQLQVAYEPEVIDLWRLMQSLKLVEPVIMAPHKKALIEIREDLDTILLRQGVTPEASAERATLNAMTIDAMTDWHSVTIKEN